ncbi:MAG: hypothetical protein F4123_03235, partial [Gemmatimonadetes bacterium]|nr:hypothetical protein [Gemmatimonadota bacterium]
MRRKIVSARWHLRLRGVHERGFGGLLRACCALPLIALVACAGDDPPVDLLLAGGSVLDGAGGQATTADVAVTGDRIVFVGDAAATGLRALDTLDVTGLVVTPGFIDMHSHAELESDHGRDARAFLYQGITSVALGV